MASSVWPNPVTAQTTVTSHCFRCNNLPLESEPALRNCGRCRARAYCSRNCQRSDWPNDKNECSTLASGGEVPNRIRTTMRVRMVDFFGEAEESSEKSSHIEELDTIYYLKFTRRNLNDVVISQPVARFTEILEQMQDYMRDFGSVNGLSALKELASGPRFGPHSLAYFNAPLPDGSVVRFDIIRESNSDVARVVSSQPTFTVRCAYPLIVPEGMIQGPDGRAQVKDMEVFQAFTTRNAAINFARSKFSELQAEDGDPILRAIPMPPDYPLMPGVVGIIDRAPIEAQRYDQIVEVREHAPRA